MHGIEGLWTVEAASLEGWTIGGALVFYRNRILGGGEHYYCIGSYKQRSRSVDGEARLFYYHGAAVNVFGQTSPDFRVTFRGRNLIELIEGEVHRSDDGNLRLPFKLVWRAPLFDGLQDRPAIGAPSEAGGRDDG